MALMTLRILRMAMVVVKEFTQPVKRLFVNVAHRNQFFRQYIIKPPSRGYQWCEKYLHMLISKDKHFEQLTEEESINLGAAIWAEIVVFLGCSKVLLVDTNKQIKQKEMADKDIIKREKILIESVEILQHILSQQTICIEQIIDALEELGKPIKRIPLAQRNTLNLKND